MLVGELFDDCRDGDPCPDCPGVMRLESDGPEWRLVCSSNDSHGRPANRAEIQAIIYAQDLIAQAALAPPFI
jgi:hypothetical protein